MRRSALALIALLVPAAGVTACGGDGGDHLAAGDGFSVETALAELPVPTEDEARRATVRVFDLAAAAEANGAGEPPESASDASWLPTATGGIPADDGEAFPPIYVSPATVLGVDDLTSSEELEEAVGFSPYDVEAVAEVSGPPATFAVVTGDVADDRYDEGVVAVDGAPGGIEQGAADGDRVALGSDREAVEAWADDGGRETLADDDALVAAAGALDDAEAVSAVLTTFVGRDSPVDALGIGWSEDDGEAQQTIAYAFEDEDEASAHRDAIEEAFGEVAEAMVLDALEVDGAVVVAHVHPGPDGRPQAPLIALEQASPIFQLSDS